MTMKKTIAEQAMNGKNGKRTKDGYEIAIASGTARKLERIGKITGINEIELVDIALNLLATHIRATSTLCQATPAMSVA
jgi:hypothetical protein